MTQVEKRTHDTSTTRTVEKRAPRRPAAGYTCPRCGLSGLAPDEFVYGGASCIDCAPATDGRRGSYTTEEF